MNNDLDLARAVDLIEQVKESKNVTVNELKLSQAISRIVDVVQRNSDKLKEEDSA